MKSDTLAQLLDTLGASRSLSRPRVSNDNPFSEAQFKTLKYQPDYPGRFASDLHARAWLQDFFAWHNEQHHHAGLALFTPADVFHDRVAVVAERRQAALDAAYFAHPERFPNGQPRARLPPTAVHINPVFTEVVEIMVASAVEQDVLPMITALASQNSKSHCLNRVDTFRLAGIERHVDRARVAQECERARSLARALPAISANMFAVSYRQAAEALLKLRRG